MHFRQIPYFYIHFTFFYLEVLIPLLRVKPGVSVIEALLIRNVVFLFFFVFCVLDGPSFVSVHFSEILHP